MVWPQTSLSPDNLRGRRTGKICRSKRCANKPQSPLGATSITTMARRPRAIRYQTPKDNSAVWAGVVDHELGRETGALREPAQDQVLRRDAARDKFIDDRPVCRDRTRQRPLVPIDWREETLRVRGRPRRRRYDETNCRKRKGDRKVGHLSRRAPAAMDKDRHSCGLGRLGTYRDRTALHGVPRPVAAYVLRYSGTLIFSSGATISARRLSNQDGSSIF
jgi:hypothetical protein